MEAQTVQVLVSAGAGLAAGTVASLVAPWVQWATEKRRLQIQHRREAIARWRAVFHEPYDEYNVEHAFRYRDEAPFHELLLHVPAEVKTELTHGYGQSKVRRIALDAIAELEKRWGLI